MCSVSDIRLLRAWTAASVAEKAAKIGLPAKRRGKRPALPAAS